MLNRRAFIAGCAVAAVAAPAIALSAAEQAAVAEEWLLCDGRSISRETYRELFQAIGGTYGSGNGVSTFNLPDLRGRVTVTDPGHSHMSSHTLVMPTAVRNFKIRAMPHKLIPVGTLMQFDPVLHLYSTIG